MGLLLAEVQAGHYISIWKSVFLLLMLLGWARLVTWIDKDAPKVLLPRATINLANVVGGIFGFLLFFLLPGFPIAFALLFLIVAAEAGVYLFLRSQKVGLGDLQGQFNNWLRSGKRPAKKPEEEAPPPMEVTLFDKGGRALPAPDVEDPDRGVYDAVQALLTDPLRRGAERVELTLGEGEYISKYVVDGVAYAGRKFERSVAASVIGYLKRTAGLDLEERRKPQVGAMRAAAEGRRIELQIQTSGSASGEQARLIADPKTRHSQKLSELGLSEPQLETTRGIMSESTGVVLISAPRGQGLTTAMYAIVRAHDAFLQNIQSIEPDTDTDLEGVTRTKLPVGTNPAECSRVTSWIISQEPDVLLVQGIEDASCVQQIAKFGADKRVYFGLRANSALEALSAWRKLVGDDRIAVRNLSLVISGRVIRKLCPACKVGYAPDPTTLRKLNMDPERVTKLYQARTTPIRDAKGNPVPCEFCKELQYKGRVGVYEMLLVDDEVREVVEAGGSVNQLKGIFRKQRGKYLQEMGLALVEAGETSVQEVLRVMKAAEGGSAPLAIPGARPPVVASNATLQK